MSELVEDFPLFLLPVVLLPTEVVPLHVFEERYRTMIDLCLDEEREFGVIWLADGGLSQVGCSAEITGLIERTDDGTMNILVRGTRPFRLVRRIEDLAYPAGDVELLDDEPGEDPEAAAEARGRYADLLERATDTRPSEGDLAQLSAYEMAASIDFADHAKQDLLEARDEGERLRALGAMFDEAIGRLEMLEQAGERAQTNGHVRLGPG